MSECPERTERVLLTERTGAVLTLTLNRPHVRNALDSALIAALRRGLAGAAADPTVEAVIITGADPAFCAGLDLKELGDTGEQLTATDGRPPAGRAWAPLPKPVIGAVNGAAITGGLEIALNCDVLIASDRAVFADTHARIGVLPGWGLSVLLPRRVGFPMARRMSFTGDFVPAGEALRIGLVTEVVPHEELLPAARRLARAMTGGHAPAVAALVESYRRIEEVAAGEGRVIEAEASRSWLTGFDPAEVARRRAGVMARDSARRAAATAGENEDGT